MPGYGGATFNIETSRDGYVPRWTHEQHFSTQHYPGSDRDDVQYGGRGHKRIRVHVYIVGAASINAFEGSADGLLRPLTDFLGEASIANVVIRALDNAKYRVWSEEFEADVTFERMG